MSKLDMQAKLEQIRSKTKSPSEVLMNSDKMPKAPFKAPAPVSPIEKTKQERVAKLKSKTKKVRVEDTHTRKTYLVRNDLLDRIEKVANNTHGFKIEFINFAIELALAELESTEAEEE